MEMLLEYVMSINSTILVIGIILLVVLSLLSLGSTSVDQQLLTILEKEEFQKEVDRVVQENLKKSTATELLTRICQLRDSPCPVVISTMEADLAAIELELAFRLEATGGDPVQLASDFINIRLYFDDPENFEI